MPEGKIEEDKTRRSFKPGQKVNFRIAPPLSRRVSNEAANRLDARDRHERLVGDPDPYAIGLPWQVVDVDIEGTLKIEVPETGRQGLDPEYSPEKTLSADEASEYLV